MIFNKFKHENGGIYDNITPRIFLTWFKHDFFKCTQAQIQTWFLTYIFNKYIYIYKNAHKHTHTRKYDNIPPRRKLNKFQYSATLLQIDGT